MFVISRARSVVLVVYLHDCIHDPYMFKLLRFPECLFLLLFKQYVAILYPVLAQEIYILHSMYIKIIFYTLT